MKDDLNSLLNVTKPSVITPHLAQVSVMTSEKKLRAIAKLVVTNMVEQFNKSDVAKAPRTVAHDGKIIEIRYLKIDDLMIGVWPAVSLMILNLSIGEQMILIDSLYPKNAQLAAKAFAVTFTPHASGDPNFVVAGDPAIIEKLDSANAGIAMLLAQMAQGGYPKPHPDALSEQEKLIKKLVHDRKLAQKHKKALNRAKEAAQSKDRGLTR